MVKKLEQIDRPLLTLLSSSDTAHNFDSIMSFESGIGMGWARLLAYITGTVDQALRNEYLVTENRVVLAALMQGRIATKRQGIAKNSAVPSTSSAPSFFQTFSRGEAPVLD